MKAITKKIVTDENHKPIAVQIDYEDWLEIEKLLDRQKLPTRGATAEDLNKHAGWLTLTEDPVEFQRRIRDEWS